MDMIQVVKSDNIIGGNSTMNADFAELNVDLAGKKVSVLDDTGKNVSNWTGASGSANLSLPLSKSIEDFADLGINLVKNGDFSLGLYMWDRLLNTSIVEKEGKRAIRGNFHTKLAARHMIKQPIDIEAHFKQGQAYTLSASIYIDSKTKIPTEAVTLELRNHYNGEIVNIVGINLDSLPKDTWVDVSKSGVATQEGSDSLVVILGAFTADIYMTNVKLEYGTEKTAYQGHPLDYITTENLFDPIQFAENAVLEDEVEKRYLHTLALSPNTDYVIATNVLAELEGYADVFATLGSEAHQSGTNGVFPYGKKYLVKRTGSDGNLKIRYRNGSLDKLKSGEHKIWVTKGTSPTVFQAFGKSPAAVNSYFINTTGGTDTIKVSVTVPTLANLYYRPSLKLINMSIANLNVGAYTTEVEPVKTGEFRDWVVERDSSTPSTIGIVLGTPEAKDSIMAISGIPEITRHESSPNLIPSNRRKFEGWNIGTGSQTTLYKVPMSVFDSSYKTNYLEFSTFTQGITANRGTVSVDNTDKSITITATTDDAYINTWTGAPRKLIKVKPNTKYTVTATKNNTETTNTVIGFFPNDSSEAHYDLAQSLTLPFTFTVPNNMNFITVRLGVGVASKTVKFSNIGVYEGETAGNSLSPKDMNNPSNPVTYNPSSDQYLLLEKAPLESLEVGYGRNYVRNGDFSNGIHLWGPGTHVNTGVNYGKQSALLNVVDLQTSRIGTSQGLHIIPYGLASYNITLSHDVYVDDSIPMHAQGSTQFRVAYTDDSLVDFADVNLSSLEKNKWVRVVRTFSFTTDPLKTVKSFSLQSISRQGKWAITNVKVSLTLNPNDIYTQAWEDLPDSQKPATRISSKGGTSNDKYILTGVPIKANETINTKILIKNNLPSSTVVKIWNGQYKDQLVTGNAKTLVDINVKSVNLTQAVTLATVTGNTTNELDIIAYNPQVMEIVNTDILTPDNKDLTKWSFSEAPQTNLIPAPLHAMYDGYLRNLYYDTGKSYHESETHGTTQATKYGRVSRKALANTSGFLTLNQLTVGKTYTFFVDVCADQETTWSNRSMYINTNTSTTHTGGTNIPTTWQTIKGTFTYKAGDDPFHLYPNAIPTTGVYFSAFAIYEGTLSERPPYRKSWEDTPVLDKPVIFNPHSGQVTLIERAPLESFNSGYSRNLVSYGKGDSLTGVIYPPNSEVSKVEVITTESSPFIRLSNTDLGVSTSINWNTYHRTLQPLMTGKTYTLSFWARRNTPQTGTTNPYTGMEFAGTYDDGTVTNKYFGITFHTIPNTNEWTKVSKTFTLTGDRSKDYLSLTINYIFRDVIGYMDIKEVKLEEGSTATNFINSWEELPVESKPAFRVKSKGTSTRTVVYTVVHGLQKGGVYIPSATIKNIGTNKAYMQFAGQRTLSLTAGEMKDVSFITTATATGHWLSILNEQATDDIDILIKDVAVTKPDNVITFPVDLPAEHRTLIIENVSFTGAGPVYVVAGTHSQVFDSPTAFKKYNISNAAIPNIAIAYNNDVSGYIGAVKLFRGFDVEEVVNIPAIYMKETRRSNLEGWYVEGEFDIEDTEHLQQDYILMIPTKTKKLQPFRIHNKEVDNDIVKIYARHVVYDLANYIVPAQIFDDFLPVTVMDRVARTMLPAKSPFRFDVTASTPVSMRTNNNTALEVVTDLIKAGGFKIDPDGFKVRIAGNLGKTTDIPLMYGSNLEGVRILENFDNVVTTMYPTLSSGYIGPAVNSDIQYGKKYVQARQFDIEIPEDKAEDQQWIDEQLVESAKRALVTAQLPSITYVVTASVPQNLEIYDTVRVYHPAITSVYGNMDKEALFFPVVVAAYEYNVISELVESLQYGTEMYNTYALLTGGTVDKIEELEERTGSQMDTMQQMIDRQTVYIDEKNKNGYIIIEENEIYAVDRLPKEEAVNVMRIGVGGIGMSSTGINGQFESAWSLEHGFNADYIRVGTLDADRIAAGSITVDHVSSTFGRDLDFQSNESINFIVGGAVAPLQNVINSQESTLTNVNETIQSIQQEINNLGDNSELVGRIELVEQEFSGHAASIDILEQYKAQSEGILRGMKLDEDGLSIFKVDSEGNPSAYKVVISEVALEFKRGSDTIAYVSGEALYIEHAIIKSSIVIGSHFIESGSITPGRTIFRQAELA